MIIRNKSKEFVKVFDTIILPSEEKNLLTFKSVELLTINKGDKIFNQYVPTDFNIDIYDNYLEVDNMKMEYFDSLNNHRSLIIIIITVLITFIVCFAFYTYYIKY